MTSEESHTPSTRSFFKDFLFFFSLDYEEDPPTNLERQCEISPYMESNTSPLEVCVKGFLPLKNQTFHPSQAMRHLGVRSGGFGNLVAAHLQPMDSRTSGNILSSNQSG